MTRFTTRALALPFLVLVAALVLYGCGSSDDASSNSATDSAATAGQMTHIDGSIALSGSTLTLTPASGDAVTKFELGPAVAKGTVQALVATSARARVFYDAASKESPLIAAAVEPAPSAGAGAKTYDGQVAKVSTTSITIDGKDGKRTFTIQAKDLPGFDVPHLNEHRVEKSAVRIYYRGKNAVAYEDA